MFTFGESFRLMNDGKPVTHIDVAEAARIAASQRLAKQFGTNDADVFKTTVYRFPHLDKDARYYMLTPPESLTPWSLGEGWRWWINAHEQEQYARKAKQLDIRDIPDYNFKPAPARASEALGQALTVLA